MESIGELKSRMEKLDSVGDYPTLCDALNEYCNKIYELEGESTEYVSALNRLGGALRDIGRLSQAEDTFQKACTLAERVFGLDSPDYATTINNTAGLYRLMRKYDRAKSLFKQASEIYDRTLGSDHILTISAANNLGLVYQSEGVYDEAEKLHAHCLVALDSTVHPIAYATTLVNLSSARIAQGKVDVENLLYEAMGIYEKELGVQHPLYATVLNTLATVKYRKGEYPDALTHFAKAAELCTVTYGSDSRNYAVALNNIADVYKVLGNEEESLRYREQSRKIFEGLK